MSTDPVSRFKSQRFMRYSPFIVSVSYYCHCLRCSATHGLEMLRSFVRVVARRPDMPSSTSICMSAWGVPGRLP